MGGLASVCDGRKCVCNMIALQVWFSRVCSDFFAREVAGEHVRGLGERVVIGSLLIYLKSELGVKTCFVITLAESHSH